MAEIEIYFQLHYTARRARGVRSKLIDEGRVLIC